MSRCLRIKDRQPGKTLPFVRECLILAALERDRGGTVAAQNLEKVCSALRVLIFAGEGPNRQQRRGCMPLLTTF